MDAPKGNGHNTGHVAPAKILKKRRADFIAACAIAASHIDLVTALLFLQFAAVVAAVLQ
jgi:hypothetical protein